MNRVIPSSVSKREIGQHYEQFALNYLRKMGLNYLARNVCYPFGELDLIMAEDDTIVFVEVRFRRSANFGGALPSITTKKRRRLLLAAAYWLQQRNQNISTCDCRFDIFAMTGQQIEWVKNAFTDE